MAASMATPDEIGLIKSYVILPMVLTIFERDKSAIEYAVRNPGPYTEAITQAMDRATVVLSEIRREFRKRGIKVYDVARDGNGYCAKYVCRGYEGEIRMLLALVQTEVNERMRAYLGVVRDEEKSRED